MGLEGISPTLIRISLQDQTSHMGTIVQTMEDQTTHAQISHSIEAMKIGLEMDLSIIRMGIGETMETFLVLHRHIRGTIHKIIPIVN